MSKSILVIEKEEIKWLIDLGKTTKIWSGDRKKYNKIISKLTKHNLVDEVMEKKNKNLSIDDCKQIVSGTLMPSTIDSKHRKFVYSCWLKIDKALGGKQ